MAAAIELHLPADSPPEVILLSQRRTGQEDVLQALEDYQNALATAAVSLQE